MNYKILLFIPLLFICAQILGQQTLPKKVETDSYKIEFPSAPDKTSQTISTAIGDLELIIIAYEVKESSKDENYVYMVMETNYPDSLIKKPDFDIEKFFRQSIDGAVNNVKGKIISETPTRFGKYESRQIEIDYGNGIAVIRMVMVLRENKLIMLQTITDSKKYPNNSIAAFLNSFEVK
jgi:tetrahydromethanopterin S-methyltransferase subunit G